MKANTAHVVLFSLILVFSWSCGIVARRTGFLSDYSGLEQVESNVWFYANPRVPTHTYSRFIVEPVESHIDLEESGFSEATVTEFAEYMHAAMVRKISENYDVVTLPGPGVARVRFALTTVSGSVPLLNIIPHTRITGAGRGGGAMEGEFLDSMTGEQIGAVVQSASAGIFESTGLTDASDIHAVLDYWANKLAENLRKYRFGEGTDG